MSLVYVFRKLVFLQVLLGVMAFCLAERNYGMMVIAGALASLSWIAVEGPSGKPLPRWLINIGSVSSVVYLVIDLLQNRGRNMGVLIALGHFTMWLQIIELYAKKSNRDYGLVLVLSLLQMVGASVLSVTMFFGAMLAAYCLLSLFTVLIFQFKAAGDLATRVTEESAPPGAEVFRPKPVVGRGYRWHFRAMAAVVGAMCAGVAALVFVFLPRASRFGDHDSVSERLLAGTAGFAEMVNLSTESPAAGRQDVVLNVTLRLQGRNIGGGDKSFLLRGAALDQYSADMATGRHVWSRSIEAKTHEREREMFDEGAALLPESTSEEVQADITLREPRSRILFTLYPASRVASRSFAAFHHSPLDQQLSIDPRGNGARRYELASPLRPTPAQMGDQAAMPDRYALGWRADGGALRAYTLDVLSAAGLSRDAAAEAAPDDEQVVAALAHHLGSGATFRYSLSNPRPAEDREPIHEFIFNLREGHCELFASALAAMSRSVGLRARVLTGYRVSEFNELGGYYVVRHTHAHAWTEVLIAGKGWLPFDATPADGVAAEHHKARSFFSFAHDLYDFLEVRWLGAIVAYDKETRDALLSGFVEKLKAAWEDDASWLGRAVSMSRDLGVILRFTPVHFIGVSAGALMLALVGGIVVRNLVRARTQAAALQIAGLSRTERNALSRRLRFYLSMLEILEAQGLRRPSWQSPRRFAGDVAAGRPELAPLLPLTEHYYEVRYGQRELDEPRRQSIDALLQALREGLAPRAGPAAEPEHSRRGSGPNPT